MKTLIATVAAVAFTGSAYATDLPSRAAPAAPPIFAQSPSFGFYAGLSGGVAFTDNIDNREATVGGTFGLQFNPFLRSELNVSNRFGAQNGQVVTADAIIGVPIYGFTPYALAGVGYGFNAYGKPNGDAAALWSVGGGVRYELTRNWEVDTRYRYTRQFNDSNADNNTVTFGLNYRF